MNIYKSFILVILLTMVLLNGTGCKRETSSSLKQQNNAQMTFYGLAVDQNGSPLEGVSFELVIESIPVNWTFETRGNAHDQVSRTVISGLDGKFHIDMFVHVLFVKEATLAGYRHLFAKSGPGNVGYLVTGSGDLCYRSDIEHPAVFVFVKDGAREVSALPSRGGYDSGNGTNWVLNKPAWPKKPSLPDVTYKPPTTQPSYPLSPHPALSPLSERQKATFLILSTSWENQRGRT